MSGGKIIYTVQSPRRLCNAASNHLEPAAFACREACPKQFANTWSHALLTNQIQLLSWPREGDRTDWQLQGGKC